MPKISVIMPTYNRSAYLCRALDSVKNQTYQDVEVIIVDDGSTDNTKNIVINYIKSVPQSWIARKIKYIYQTNKGVACARNTGIKHAEGFYVTFLDSDDIWFANKLEIQKSFFDNNPHIDFLYGKQEIRNENNEKIGEKSIEHQCHNFEDLIFNWGHFGTSTVMMKKKCFDKIGYFDEGLFIMEDIDLWIRLSRHFKIGKLDSPSGAYYRHSQNITLDKELVYFSTARVYEKILNEYPNDIPKRRLMQRISQYRYQLGRLQFSKKKYDKATQNIWLALQASPYVWRETVQKKDSFIRRSILFLKPLIAMLASFLLMIFYKRKCATGEYIKI